MICRKCKREIPDDSIFCPECGANQETAENSVKLNTNSGSRKKFAAVLGGLLGIVLIVVAAVLMIKPTINLNDYLTVSFEGYDTVGRAVAEFDEERFRDAYKGELPEEFVSDYVDWEFDRDRDLSNGDSVQLTWNCRDEEVLSRYGYKMKYEDIPCTVSGLSEIGSFDPFKGIEVVFEGISPEGTAEISGNPTEAAAKDLKYELDKNEKLKNGDTVTVSVTARGEDPSDYCIRNYGVMPDAVTKTYTVDGLDQYVKSLSEISGESLLQMQNQAQDVFNAYVASDFGDGEKVTEFTYMGNYLLTAKDETYYDQNALYLVYKVLLDQTSEDGEVFYSSTNELYWFIEYDNLLVNADGEVSVNITDYHTPENRVEFYPDENNNSFYWWYYGYAALEELYEDVVTINSGEYSCEDGVSER